MTKNSEKIVVVAGATGHQGGAVARHLLDAGFAVRGLTRNTGTAAAAELSGLGAEMMKCDLDDAAAARRALDGAWGAFGVFAVAAEGPQQEEKQSVMFAEQALAAGVQHYVYSSVASAQRNTGIPHFDNKWRVENAVRGMGFPSYTILRPAFFMDNFLGPWMWPGIAQGKLTMALKPTTKLQMIAVDDIGAYGLMAFLDFAQLNRAEIELAGDEMTMPEAAEIISGALNRKVTFEQQPIEQVRKASEDMVTMYEWFDRVGLSVDIEELKKYYALQPATFSQWAAMAKWPVPAHR